MLPGCRAAACSGVVTAMLLVGSGCLQLEQTLMLNGDGSLAARCHYSVADDSEALLAAASAVLQEWQGRSAVAPGWFASEAAIREHVGSTGVTLQGYRRYRAGGRHHIEIMLFAEYGPAALNTGLFGPLRCERLPDGLIRLRTDLPAMPSAPGGLDPQALLALAHDLYLRLEIKVPGEIRQTTAGSQRRTTATWEFDPSRDAAFLRAPPAVECSFDAARLAWAERVPWATP